VLYQFNSSLD